MVDVLSTGNSGYLVADTVNAEAKKKLIEVVKLARGSMSQRGCHKLACLCDCGSVVGKRSEHPRYRKFGSDFCEGGVYT
jgi:hypothetical protein